MTSVTSICNLALSKIRANVITTIGENTVEARNCLIFYDPSRRAALEAHPWNFATRKVALARDATYTAAFGLAYRFALPADFLRIIQVDWEDLDYSDGWSLPYRIEDGYLHADESSVSIEYIYDCEDPNKFSATFVDMLAERLAAELSLPLADNSVMSEKHWNVYESKLREARNTDAQQGTPRGFYANVWTQARL